MSEGCLIVLNSGRCGDVSRLLWWNWMWPTMSVQMCEHVKFLCDKIRDQTSPHRSKLNLNLYETWILAPSLLRLHIIKGKFTSTVISCPVVVSTYFYIVFFMCALMHHPQLHTTTIFGNRVYQTELKRKTRDGPIERKTFHALFIKNLE